MLKDNLVRIRKSKNITQEEIAEHLNIKRQTYSAYERGVSIPDTLTLIKIAKYYNVSLDELAGEKESPILITQHGGDGPIIVRNDKKTEREKSLDALVLACQKLSPEQINALLATAQLMTPKDGKE